MKRPPITAAVVEALKYVGAEANAAILDEAVDEHRRAQLRRGVEWIEELRAWFVARTPRGKPAKPSPWGAATGTYRRPFAPPERPPVNATVRVVPHPDEPGPDVKALAGLVGRVVSIYGENGERGIRVRFRHGVNTVPAACLVVVKR